MEKTERLEYKICDEIYRYFHTCLPISKEEGGKLIYELTFLRLLSIRSFKEIINSNNIVSLEEFINIYKNNIDTLVKEDIEHSIISDTEIHLYNLDECIKLAFEVLDDIQMYKYSLKNLTPVLSIFCSYNGIVLKNIMNIDLYEGSRRIDNTPEQICNIVSTLLDINKDDTVLDIGSSYGNFLTYVNRTCECRSLNGIEINSNNSLISRIRLMCLSQNFNIENKDLFRVPFEHKYDKILCNYPWGIRYQKYEYDYLIEHIKEMKFKWDKINNNSLDWLFVDSAITRMKNNGKCALIMTGGPLFRVNDEQYRKDLIDNGLIEMVVKIPTITHYTSIDQYLVILSENNTSVKLIDVSKFVERNYNRFNVDMKSVFETINSNNKNVSIIKNEDIAKNGYVLTVDNYVGKKEITYHNPKKLKEYVIDVFRGYQMTSKEQKELESENGEFEVLMISDIEDGQISDKLTKIDVKDSKYDRYLIKENDLIISSKGTRIKIAVVSNIGDRKIIANGNLIVLRLDTSKINPFYLEMYLNSSDGQTILNQIQTGSVIISINPSRLVEITISTLPIEKQNEIADNYKSKQFQIMLAKEHIKQLEQEKDTYFEKEIEELFN